MYFIMLQLIICGSIFLIIIITVLFNLDMDIEKNPVYVIFFVHYLVKSCTS